MGRVGRRRLGVYDLDGHVLAVHRRDLVPHLHHLVAVQNDTAVGPTGVLALVNEDRMVVRPGHDGVRWIDPGTRFACDGALWP